MSDLHNLIVAQHIGFQAAGLVQRPEGKSWKLFRQEGKTR